MEKKKIVTIMGPTAVGKTEVVLRLAEKFGNKGSDHDFPGFEILSCDSMQIYKGMDIGSAKPGKEELDRIPHHLIDIVDPVELKKRNKGKGDFFTVAQYYELAEEAIDKIVSRGNIPLITGGTGLYLDSIIYDLDFGAGPDGAALGEGREELYGVAEEEGPEALHDVLKDLDPDAANRIHPNNIKRVVRAIETARQGEKIGDYSRDFTYREEYEPILIGLTRDREELYDRINRRVDLMMEAGLLDEVRALRDKGLTSEDYSMKGIGYKELMEYLDGNSTSEEAVTAIKTNSRHYAKRQITWFKKYDDMKWFDLTGVTEDSVAPGKSYDDIIGEIEEWLTKKL